MLLLLLCLGLLFGPFLLRQGKKMAYPLEYKAEIIVYANMYELDPYLVMGLIFTESRFDPDAVSTAGATGLMQIMPETGAWLAEKMELSDFDSAQLYDEAFNIRMGCYYLKLLSDYYGVLRTALAAYNAGIGSVNGWLRDPACSADGVTLDTIPYPETAEYVEKVAENAEMYLALYR